MLNETWRLWQALERSRFELAPKHKRVQTPGRTSPCVRVRLDKSGGISSVEDIGNDEWPSWTVMEGKQSSFPVVRVQKPLFSIDRGHETWTELGCRWSPPARGRGLKRDIDLAKVISGSRPPRGGVD
jgi:hypothetical protein